MVPISFPFHNKNSSVHLMVFSWWNRPRRAPTAVVIVCRFVGFLFFFFSTCGFDNEFLHCAVRANPWPFIKCLVVQSCRDCWEKQKATTANQVRSSRDEKLKADAVFFFLFFFLSAAVAQKINFSDCIFVTLPFFFLLAPLPLKKKKSLN